MRDGMEKGAPVINRKQYMLICALAGLLILSGVLIFRRTVICKMQKSSLKIPSAMLRSSAPATTT